MAQKFVPYEKLSKKEKREVSRKRRRTWSGISPVTRRPENPKAYNRQQARRDRREDDNCVPFYSFYSFSQPSITRTTRSVACPSQAAVCACL
ncbi:MAG: hypothetical protein IJT41_08065 [Clostridia bacterium]|nr:hypothetical protein [Clostridia bacterium]